MQFCVLKILNTTLLYILNKTVNGFPPLISKTSQTVTKTALCMFDADNISARRYVRFIPVGWLQNYFNTIQPPDT